MESWRRVECEVWRQQVDVKAVKVVSGCGGRRRKWRSGPSSASTAPDVSGDARGAGGGGLHQPPPAVHRCPTLSVLTLWTKGGWTAAGGVGWPPPPAQCRHLDDDNGFCSRVSTDDDSSRALSPTPRLWTDPIDHSAHRPIASSNALFEPKRRPSLLGHQPFRQRPRCWLQPPSDALSTSTSP